MKSFKKTLAMLLSVTFIIGSVSMPALTSSAESTEALGSYQNDFNVNGDLSKITKDFNIYYDSKAQNYNQLADITSDPSKYFTVANNRLERLYDEATEKDTANDANRPYWRMAYYTYKNQQFKNFTLSVDAYFPLAGSNYNAITVGALGGGVKSNGGFTFGMQNKSGTTVDVYLGSEADVNENFNDWWIHNCTGKATYTHADGDKNFKIILTVKDGKASATINGTSVLKDIEVGEVTGYISLVNGFGNNLYYDNLSITSLDAIESTFERTEELGKYSNNFDVNGLNGLITQDFNLYFDTKDQKYNTLSNITADPSKYMTFANNRLERIFDEATELKPWDDGNRPYWCMAYYTYKNQNFKNFKLMVDAYMPDWGSTYNGITVGNMGAGFKNNGGFTLGFQHNAGLNVYLGSAADVATNFDDWYIHGGELAVIDVTEDSMYKIELTVLNGKATVAINGTAVLTDVEVGEVSGYVSLVNGIKAGSYYDNLTITSLDKSTYSRTEETGLYENNFDVAGYKDLITKDFNLYFDTIANSTNTMSNITTDPSRYMTFANNRLERIFDEATELLPWNDGNRPYWCMAYYTYKNQTFKDFKLTVDANFNSYGSSYYAITVGSMGAGLKSNGGFTLGFQDYGGLQVYLGSVDDVRINFDDWYIHGGAVKTIEKTKDNKYNIELTVFGGLATVKINGTEVLKDIYVGYLDGYVSLVSGLNTGAYYDNLKIQSISEDATERNAAINFEVEPMGDITAVNMSLDSNVSYLNTLTDLAYDDTAFEYIGTRLEAAHIKINKDSEVKADDGLVTIPLYCTVPGKVATVYFKNLNGNNDYSGFSVYDPSVTLLNNHEVAATADIALFGDYNEDNSLSIADLVRAKKLSAEEEANVIATDITELRKVLLGMNIDEISPLLGKTSLYLGDSIAYGAGDSLGLSWAGRIAERGISYENVAVSGWAVTNTATSGRGQIVTQLDRAKKSDYDFVILEGGVNDVLISERESAHPIAFGEITADGTEYDTSTICGAIEDLIVKTKAKFPNATVGYIINNYYGATETDMQKYISAVKTACEKHGIAYVDLYNDEYVKANFVNSSHLPDNLHPNAAGYDILTKVIADWMETLVK